MKTLSTKFFLIAMLAVLWDVQAKDATLFPRPSMLKPAIEFWTRIYTEVDTNGGFIHDDRNLNIVYEVLRFDPNTGKRSRNRTIKHAKRKYRMILLSLAKGKRANLSDEEQRVLSLWPESIDNSGLRNAASRLRFQLGQSNRFRDGLRRAGTWQGFITKKLRELDLPQELAALPFVESSYNPNAWSKVGAAGLWQFTRSTGRRFMRVDHVVDERMDPYTASIAAARLLKYNHSILGSWPLAITAYNHGVAGMRRAVRKTGGKDIAAIVQGYDGRLFGFASRNFYTAFLAALDVSSEAERYFGDYRQNEPRDPRVVKLTAYLPAQPLARSLGTDQKTLQQVNPALQESVWIGIKHIPIDYALRLPNDVSLKKAEKELATLTLAQGFPEQKPDLFHRVRRGDTLSGIARYYKTSINELMALNLLRSRHRIRAGEMLRLPVSGDGEPIQVASAETAPFRPAAHEADSGMEVLDGQVEKASTDIAETAPEASDQTKAGRLAMAKPLSHIPDNLETDTESASAPENEVVAEEAGDSNSPLGSLDQAQLSADPADYTVGDDESIEIQAAETLGHYAEWLGIRASDLRRLNRMRYGQALVVGKRLRLDFTKVARDRFEEQRISFHNALQTRFFRTYRISDTSDHALRQGDSLWTLAHQVYDIPVWLLRQYNPDVDFNSTLPPGTPIVIPRVDRYVGGSAMPQADRSAPTSSNI